MSLFGDLIKRGLMFSHSEIMFRVLTGKKQAAPTAMTGAAAITAAAIKAGLITGTHTVGATQAYTLPTGTVMDAALTSFILVNDSFDFTIINLSAALLDTITLTAAAGFTIVGQALVESAHANSEFPSSGTFRVRKTAANTFVAYRL
jgi:hypothetical protein